MSVFSAVYDRLYTPKNREIIEHSVVALSVLGFLAHLVFIFLANHLRNPPPLVSEAGHNYLTAIATPFNFILFYEVLILISAIPQSTTKSIETQFEIVSLIFIRGFFQDIAEIDLDRIKVSATELMPAIQDVVAGIVMFFLVTVFRHITRKRDGSREMSPALVTFINRKKAVSLALTVLFFALAGRNIWRFAVELARGSVQFHTGFYAEVFTVMIFTDVLILLLSLLVSDHYELVFRNAAFVISTILIRTALTAGHPDGAEEGVAGMVFGILTVLIYNYYVGVAVGRKAAGPVS